MMGGRIWVESQVGQGSTFYVALTLGVLPEAQASASEVYSLANKKVLLIGERQGDVSVLQQLVGERKDTLTRVKDVESASHEIDRATLVGLPYDVILLDFAVLDNQDPEVRELFCDRPALLRNTILVLDSEQEQQGRDWILDLKLSGLMLRPLKKLRVFSCITGPSIGEVEPTKTDKLEAGLVSIKAPEAFRILLVEDNPDNQLVVKSFLKDQPYTLGVAQNGQLGVDMHTGNPFNLILMDMQMPVMDGFTATRKIREWEKEHKRTPVPILAFTAYAFAQEIQKSVEAGCNGHLTKPIRKKDLLETIIRYIPEASQASQDKIYGEAREGEEIVSLAPDLSDLVPGYLDNRRKDLEQCRAALAQGEFETIHRLMHSMAGSGGSFGFDMLSAIGRQLDRAAKEREAEAVSEGLDHLADYLDRIKVVYE
jgi:CheY-like chemotaxis protein